MNTNPEYMGEWSRNELRMLKHMLENDGIAFFRYFFKIREGEKAILSYHHFIVEYCLQAVIDLKINRLIINIAPGYSKTETAVLNFIARGIAINHRAKFIHSSYSGDLASENSSKIRDTIVSPEFQALWPMSIRTDKKGKKRWFTDSGGGMMAAPAKGQITGFRAGRMSKGFTGAFVLDDPVKPDDAYSIVKRSAINNRFNNTMRSRLAVESVPFVIIKQRIHEDDLTGFLLRGGSGDMWHHLSIPTLLSEDLFTTPYDKSYTHGIPIALNGILTAIKGGKPYEFQ